MKNFFKIALALAIALSMTACGGETQTEDPEISNDPQQNIQQEADSPTQNDESEEPELPEDEPVEPEITEEPVDSESEEPEVEPEVPSEPEKVEGESLFDTSWASNEYEKLIPQPPFEGWEGEMLDSNVYEIHTSEANADGSGEYYAKFGTYLNSLRQYDFSVDGDEYSSVAYDPNGNEIRFKCGDGWAWITFFPMEDLSGGELSDVHDDEPIDEVSTPAFSTDWASNEMEKLIPEPPMIIARSYDDNGSWVMTNRVSDTRLADEARVEVTEAVARTQVLEYFDQLRAYGFIERSPIYENKTEIEDVIGAFFLTPDEKYSITIWHYDDYDMSISIKAVE